MDEVFGAELPSVCDLAILGVGFLAVALVGSFFSGVSAAAATLFGRRGLSLSLNDRAWTR